jgi:ribosomal subunit interface protein
MKVQINTGHNIESSEAMIDHFKSVVKIALSRISDHITRVEVHLNEENSHQGIKNDKRCMMEARLEGRKAIAVNHQAATMTQAVDGAADKLTRLIDSTRERLRDQKIRRTDPVSNGREIMKDDFMPLN